MLYMLYGILSLLYISMPSASFSMDTPPRGLSCVLEKPPYKKGIYHSWQYRPYGGYFQQSAEEILNEALKSNDIEKVKQLLWHPDIIENPNALISVGVTPFLLAAFYGAPDVVQAMLDRGALVNMQVGDDKVAPLHGAASVGNREVIQLLLEQGACIDTQTQNRMTPLHWAALGFTQLKKLSTSFDKHMQTFKALLFYPHGIADYAKISGKRYKGVLSLKDMCLDCMTSKRLKKNELERLPPNLSEILIKLRNQKRLAYIKHLLLMGTSCGLTVRDSVAQDDFLHRKSHFAIGFMDQVLNTTTTDDLKVLEYEDEV